MRQKDLVLKKLQELKNFVNGERALISTARSTAELLQQLERIEAKMQEIEVLINRENQEWS